MEYKVFVSATTVEFKDLREKLAAEIDQNPIFSPKSFYDIEGLFSTEEIGPVISVEQSKFGGSAQTTLVKLAHLIWESTAIVHVLGKRGGSHEGDSRNVEDGLPNYESIKSRHPDLPDRLKLDEDFLKKLTYTQWEAWLAIYYGHTLVLVEPSDKYEGDDNLGNPMSLAEKEQQQLHIRHLLKRKGLRPAIIFDSLGDLMEQLSKSLAQQLDPDLSALYYEKRAEPIIGEMIDIGKISVYIVSSSQGLAFCQKLGKEMGAYCDPAKPHRQVFTTKLSQVEDLHPGRMEERYADSSLFLFYLRDVDEHVRAILDFAVSHQFTFDKRRVRIVGIMDGPRENISLVDMGRVKADGAPINPDIYEFDASKVQYLEEGKYEKFFNFVHQSFHPLLTMFSCRKDFDDEDKKCVFDNAMAMYQFLIPDPNERDDPNNIQAWIGNYHGDRLEWFDFLLVAHYPAGDPFAALWCNIHFKSGFGHVPFWGARARHRAHGTAVAVAGHALTVAAKLMDLQVYGSRIKAMIFEAEPVDLDFMRDVIANACRRLDPPVDFPSEYSPANEELEEELLKRISLKDETAHGELSPLQETILEIAKDRTEAERFDDQLRRFRRLQMYAGNRPAANTVKLDYSFQIYGFYQKSASGGDDELSVYWQPPIVPNPKGKKFDVNEEDGCFFHLFLLVNLKSSENSQETIPNISAKEVVDWEYEHFLGEQFRDEVHPTGLKGWNACLERNLARRNNFANNAKLARVELGDAYWVAERILKTVSFWPSHREDWKTIDPISGKL